MLWHETTTQLHNILVPTYVLTWNGHMNTWNYSTILWFYLQLPHKYKTFHVPTMIFVLTATRIEEFLVVAYDFTCNYQTIAQIFRHRLWFYLPLPDNCMNFQAHTMILLANTGRLYESSGRTYALVYNYQTIAWYFQAQTMILVVTATRIEEFLVVAYDFTCNCLKNRLNFCIVLCFDVKMPHDYMNFQVQTMILLPTITWIEEFSSTDYDFRSNCHTIVWNLSDNLCFHRKYPHGDNSFQ
jgi:hypothetical protein